VSIPTANPSLALRLTDTQTVAEVLRPDTAGRVALLTRGLVAGDEAAFREFHDLYFDRLYQFLLVVARGREDEAQEALQLTFLRVLRYVRAFDSEGALWSWLRVLARSAARDAGRKQQRYFALLERFALQRLQAGNPPAFAEDDRLRGLLEESLEELEPGDRRLLESKYLDGATVRELSAEAGLTEKAVESRLVRLRRDLRRRLLGKLRTT
jgi:RNA polymerase sigma-70 factor (ECF subfamily)